MKDYKENIYRNYYSTHTKDQYGDFNIESINRQFPVYAHYYQKYLPDFLDSKIIDLGCGMGDFVYWLQSLGYKNFIGVDVSEELITLGKEAGFINLVCEDIFNFLQSNDDDYDLIILRDVLEHFNRDDVYKLIKLLNHKLKAYGSIIIQTPNGQSPLVGKILYGDFTHHTAYTKSSLNQLFKSNGFSQIEIIEVMPVPKNIKGKIRLILWKLLRTYFKMIQLIATGDASGYFTPNLIAKISK